MPILKGFKTYDILKKNTPSIINTYQKKVPNVNFVTINRDIDNCRV